jgi:hypothetical protein
MNTAMNITHHQKVFLHSQRVEAIDFNDLRANDIIIIGTQNTCYSFVITCEAGMYGKLQSDSQNNFFTDAVLFGSVAREGEDDQPLMPRLEAQSHALFLVQQGDKVMKVITSLITSLRCLRPVE